MPPITDGCCHRDHDGVIGTRCSFADGLVEQRQRLGRKAAVAFEPLDLAGEPVETAGKGCLRPIGKRVSAIYLRKGEGWRCRPEFGSAR
jgi:hypothetical protein